MVNPSHHLRLAWKTALESATGLNMYDYGIPIDTSSLPSEYILYLNESKDPFSRDKEGYEWLLRPSVELCSVNEKGFISTLNLDLMEEQVITAIDAGISIGGGFTVNFSRFIDSVNLAPIETQTHTISRKSVIYEHWVNYVT